MTVRQFVRTLFRSADVTPARAPRPAARGARARSARRALACGALVFAALTVALAVAAETKKPEWRDPEYGHRLKRMREIRRFGPDRPLVVVIGSSRAQMGVSPHEMGLPNERTAP